VDNSYPVLRMRQSDPGRDRGKDGTMTVSERARHELHGRLEEMLGTEEAATLMTLLPPVGWADVATKRDLDALSALTKRDLDALRADLHVEVSGLRAELHREISIQTRTLMISLLTAVVTVASLAFGAASLV
jgi:hypothetical protein